MSWRLNELHGDIDGDIRYFGHPKSSEFQHKIAAARAARGVEPPHFLLTSFIGYVRTWFKGAVPRFLSLNVDLGNSTIISVPRF